jgi:hypothetical protein
MAKVCTLNDYIFNRPKKKKKKKKPADALPFFSSLLRAMNYHLALFFIHGHLFVTDILNDEFIGKSRKYQILFI